jgi:hypothetical protein
LYPTEIHDLADKHPERLKEMIDLWYEEADKYNVLPLQGTVGSRVSFGRNDRLQFPPRLELGGLALLCDGRGHDRRFWRSCPDWRRFIRICSKRARCITKPSKRYAKHHSESSSSC